MSATNQTIILFWLKFQERRNHLTIDSE